VLKPFSRGMPRGHFAVGWAYPVLKSVEQAHLVMHTVTICNRATLRRTVASPIAKGGAASETKSHTPSNVLRFRSHLPYRKK
jgi:hypothetical protein